MKKIIMERLHCSEKRAALIESDLKCISKELEPLLNKWLSDGICNDETLYNGYSLNSLMNGWHMQFTGALLTLDWLIKEPQNAVQALSAPIL